MITAHRKLYRSITVFAPGYKQILLFPCQAWKKVPGHLPSGRPLNALPLYVDIPDAKVTDNTVYDSSQKFGQVTVSQLRLLITKTQDNIARLWEIEFYQQP